MPFSFLPLEIPDIILIKPTIFHDNRGSFAETFKEKEFRDHGISRPFVQDNYSKSHAHVLRGLHYQAHPKAQGKLINVLYGSVFDVVVDIRVGSSTYGKWVSVILDAQENSMLWVPPGFAHGFYVLTEHVDFLYKCTEYYEPSLERGLRWDDTELNIPWPEKHPIVSIKDQGNPYFRELQNELSLGYAQ